jgi:hypothetical protein
MVRKENSKREAEPGEVLIRVVLTPMDDSNVDTNGK